LHLGVSENFLGGWEDFLVILEGKNPHKKIGKIFPPFIFQNGSSLASKGFVVWSSY
jgi:hypothetical protein